jgi:hypothetical protein
MGGIICWVDFTRDISGKHGVFGFISDKVYALEHFVAGLAPAATCPPAFDDSAVVSINFKMNPRGTRADDG